MLTVGDVLLHGRDIHPGFDDQWTGGAPLMRALDRYQRRLVGRLVDWKDDLFKATHTISLPLASFAAGATDVPDYMALIGGDVVFTSASRRREELIIVPYAKRLVQPIHSWGAYAEKLEPRDSGTNNVLKLMGEASDWTPVSSVELHYIPEVAELSTASSEFSLPGDALDVLAEQAALFLAKRKRGTDPTIDLEQFQRDAQIAEDAYIDHVTGRGRASVGVTKEVW